MRIRASHPMNIDNTDRLECYEIVSFSLKHKNGCHDNQDVIMESIIKQRGRKYSRVALDHIQIEVLAGRYSTKDVKGWLVDQGYKDGTLEEATNPLLHIA